MNYIRSGYGIRRAPPGAFLLIEDDRLAAVDEDAVLRCQRTAWARRLLQVRPLRIRSSTLWRCVTRATSCLDDRPSSSTAVA